MAKGDVIAIQVGSAEPEIHKDWSVDQCIEAVRKIDERVAASLRATEQRLAAIHKEVLTDPDMVVEYYSLQRAQSETDMLLSSELENLSPEAQRKRVDHYHRYSTLGSALLYRDGGFGCGSKFFTTTWPNFSWWPYSFDNRASSAKAWAGNIIFDHPWYKGRRLYLIGVPYVEFPDLGVFGFNDIASSFASIS